MHERDWVSAHIFYQDHLDPVLVRLVSPLAAELAADGLVTRWFFLRYWDGGNHLRLRLLADPRDHHEVRTRVQARCAAFFRARPAPERVRPEEYAAHATRLAAIEGVSEYARHPYPNNSVAFIPYRREHDRYGHGAAIEAVERHFAESSQIALRLITAGLPGARRDTAAFCLILLTWYCCGSPGRFSVPAASHPAEAEGRYQRQAAALSQIAARMSALASLGVHAPGNGAFAAWTRSVTRLRGELGEGSATVLDSCAHLVCNRLGVNLDAEADLRYLAIRTLAEATAKGPHHAMV